MLAPPPISTEGDGGDRKFGYEAGFPDTGVELAVFPDGSIESWEGKSAAVGVGGMEAGERRHEAGEVG